MYQRLNVNYGYFSFSAMTVGGEAIGRPYGIAENIARKSGLYVICMGDIYTGVIPRANIECFTGAI